MNFLLKYKKRIKQITIIVLLSIIIILLILTRYPRRVFNSIEEDVIYKGNKQEKLVSFACNIDWGNEYIPGILDTLERHNVKITFFITGRWADKYSDITKQIFDKGHEIGNHGYYHKDYSKFSYNNAIEDIKKADSSLDRITNTDIKLFSPPSGAYNPNVIKAVSDLDYGKIILWSIDTIDWNKSTTKEKIYNRIFDKLEFSDIILIHPTKNTADILDKVLTELINKGYKIVPISDLLN